MCRTSAPAGPGLAETRRFATLRALDPAALKALTQLPPSTTLANDMGACLPPSHQIAGVTAGPTIDIASAATVPVSRSGLDKIDVLRRAAPMVYTARRWKNSAAPAARQLYARWR